MMRLLLLLLILLAGSGLSAEAQRAVTASPGVRPPYLQNDQGTEVTVCWTTRRAIRPEVRWRPVQPAGEAQELEAADALAGDGPPARRHQVTLKELRPGTPYEYRVRQDAGYSPWTRFRTRPEGPGPFRFGVFGDYGAGTPGQAAVTRLLERLNPEFALVVGDLVYPAGTEATLTRRFFLPLSRYAGGHVIWHVFGNHDVAGAGGRPLERASVAPGNGPPGVAPGRVYSFEYGAAHFVVLDSNLPARELRTRVRPWLAADLRATDRRWKFVFLHHPPFSTGTHGDSGTLQSLLVPTFAREGVDAVFAGHDHQYSRYRPIDGVTYVVSGNGGAGLYPFRRRDPRVAFRQNHVHGITVIEVSPEKALLRHVSTEGREIDRAELR